MSEYVAVVEAVDKGYPDGRGLRRVLSGVELEVPAGRIIGVQGPSGCGKTTLLSIVGGLLRHDRGRVVVAGNELDHTRPSDVARVRRRHVGLITQAYGLIETESALSNIMLPLMLARPRISRQARMAAVERATDRAALDVDLRMRVATLSHGEKQRVAIARALVRTPSLLVADEPTSALDAATGSRIVALLRAAADQGIGVLVATHDPQVAEACDLVHRFEGPRLTAGDGLRAERT